MKKLCLSCAALLLLAACSFLQANNLLPTSTPDAAQSIAALQITYQGLAGAAQTWVDTGKPNAAQLKAINQANEVAHSAVASAVSALEACSIDPTTNKYTTSCINGALVTGAFSTATSAVQQFSDLLNTNGVTTSSSGSN